ncbi:MAG TPA: hypothetical protein VHS80_01540 [Chthoniobacterales bacterium]|nr:hypothetical protein [Chthoniobacterales bacterium]
MAQKPVVPKSRSTVKRARKRAATDSVKRVKKAAGVRGSTLGNIDSLINKHLATFRNAEKALAEAKALVETYRQKYPELTDYIPRAVEKRGIQIREDASDESQGSHDFYVRIRWGEQRYEVARAGEHDYQQVDAATWIQRFKEQLAVSIAKIVFAREAAQAPK